MKMAQMSAPEQEFSRRFPHTRVETDSSSGYRTKYTVFAGDYVVSEGYSRYAAFKSAMDYVTSGLVTPDPAEMSKPAS